MSEAQQLAQKKRLAILLRMRQLQGRRAAEDVARANTDLQRAEEALIRAEQRLSSLDAYKKELVTGGRLSLGLYVLTEPYQVMAQQGHEDAREAADNKRLERADAAVRHHRAVAAEDAISGRLDRANADIERQRDHAQIEAACRLRQTKS